MNHAVSMSPGHTSGPAIVRRRARRTVAMFRRSAVIHTGYSDPPNVMDVLSAFGTFLLIALVIVGLSFLMPEQAAVIPDVTPGSDGSSIIVPAMAVSYGRATNSKGKSAESAKVVKQVRHVAEVKKMGEALIIPDRMTYKQVRELLEAKERAEEELTPIHRHFKGIFPYEGALAFNKAAVALFGIAPEATQSWWGPRVTQVTVDVGPGETTQVPFGSVRFLGAEDTEELSMGFHFDDATGEQNLCISGSVKGKHMDVVNRLFDMTEAIARKESIYRGKALKMSWTSVHPFTRKSTPAPVPHIQFLDLSAVDTKSVVFNKDVEDIISANVFGHITNREVLKKLNVPFKMGALFAGKYGTGKSLLARAIAKVATDNGVTFIYLKDSTELAKALDFAMQYQPAVVFAEDIDQVLAGDDEQMLYDEDGNPVTPRNIAVTQIVNLLDGIDSKDAQVMTILTTNHLDRINKVLLRPGRIDLAVHIPMPDEEAVARLFRLYGGKDLDPEADVAPASRLLAGHTPALIREVIERSKRIMVARTGSFEDYVSGEDVRLAAETVLRQAQLIEGEQPKRELTLPEAILRGQELVALAIAGQGEASEGWDSRRARVTAASQVVPGLLPTRLASGDVE